MFRSVNQALEPEYAHPNQPAKIIFSVQDQNGNDVPNIMTMVEIYSEKTGDRLATYPWTKHNTGDFEAYYTFSDIRNYQIVLSIANSNINANYNIQSSNEGLDKPRTILSNNLDCNCERGVFNISISNSFGSIFLSSAFAGVVAMMVVLGLVLVFTYIKRRRDHGANAAGEYAYESLGDKQILRYSVLLLALAAGCIHLVVFSEHGSLRIEYSIFLLIASGSQVAYGILYVLLALTGGSVPNRINYDIASVRADYRKTVILNLFGLVGSAILLVLYAYSVVLPPPLSPNNRPDAVDISGVLVKSMELFLIIGIVYLMRWEKKKMERQVAASTREY